MSFTEKGKGYGFVEFEDEEDARAAIDNMDGTSVYDIKILLSSQNYTF